MNHKLLENSVIAEATYDSQTGQLVLDRFEIVVDGSRVSTLDPTKSVDSPHIPRLIFVLHEFSLHDDPKIPKRDGRWKLLWGFLRKVCKGELKKPGWYVAVFQDFDVQVLFPDTGRGDQRPTRFVNLDRDRFPRESMSVTIRRKESSAPLTPNETSKLLDELTGVTTGHADVPRSQLRDPDYARQLAAELQVPMSENERFALGKAIWLSRLVILGNLIQGQLLSDEGYFGRLKVLLDNEQSCNGQQGDTSFLKPEDIDSWTTRVDAFQRLIGSSFFTQPAEKVGFDVDGMKQHITRLLLATVKYSSGETDIKELALLADDVRRELSRSMISLHEKVAECRECFGELWRACRS